MSISFLVIFLGILGSSLSAVLMLDSVFKVFQSLKSYFNEESEPQEKEEEVIVSLISKDKHGNIITEEQVNIPESEEKKLRRNLQSYSH